MRLGRSGSGNEKLFTGFNKWRAKRMTTDELIKRLNKNEREKYNQEEIMTKK